MNGTKTDSVAEPSVAFFRRGDWMACAGTFLFVLAVYTFTLAPTVTLEDAGELAVAADYLGVPHPPGYPIWTLLAWFFQWIFGFVSFQGHPNPAWGVTFMSGFFGALASGLIALLVSRSGRDMLEHWPSEAAPKRRDWRVFGVAALVGCLGCFLLSNTGPPSPVDPSEIIPVTMDRLVVWFLMCLVFLYVALCFAAGYVFKWTPTFSNGLPVLIPFGHLGSLLLGLFMGGVFFVGVWMTHLPTLGFAIGGMALLVGGDAVLHALRSRFGDRARGDVAAMAPFVGAAVSLLFAFSPLVWSQCTIIEVYSLNAFFMVSILVLTYLWMWNPDNDRLLYVTCFVFGLGLTNHHSLLFILPFPLLAIALRRPPLFLNGLAAAMAAMAAVVLSKIALPSEGSSSGSGVIKFAMYFALLGMPAVYFAIQKRWISLVTVVCLHLALVVVIVRTTIPDPMEPVSKLWVAFVAIASLSFLLVPLIFHFTARPRFALWLKIYGMLGWIAAGLSFLLYMPVASEQNPPMNWGYARTYKGFKHVVSRGQYEAIDPIKNLGIIYRNFHMGAPHREAFEKQALMSADAELNDLLVDLRARFSGDELAAKQAELKRQLDSGAVLDAHARYVEQKFFFFKQLAAFFYNPGSKTPADTFSMVYQYTIPLSLLGLLPLFMIWRLPDFFRGWFYSIIIAMVFVSFVFIIFQFPNLDVQDLFIKRVQYLQAHAVYAVWVGYGSLIALLLVRALVPSPFVVKALALALLMTCPAVGLWRDSSDSLHLNTSGSSSLRGHDFGWQFGRYQLEGIEGILAELDPQENPPPHADYPPPMEPNAIFFGGTDPGRFVPTYMIFSAKVRPDVFLITQNALADHTYMNVMRDLYGDKIWLPAVNDTNDAFRQYYAEVQAGRVNAGADLTSEGGMMRVSGVQGVMQINAKMCRQMFDRNKDRHSFYVEESYPIPWMYPYLTPHGLILKLNAEPTEITQELMLRDFEFWEWYIARLKANPRFSRDVIAQKTFSKLRGAIAGLYAARGFPQQAEQAFLQALDLYPMSPEASMRLAQMYMQTQRVHDAELIARRLVQSDPGNKHIQDFLRNVATLKAYDRQRIALEKQLRTPRASAAGMMRLLQIYGAMGMATRMDPLARNLMRSPGIQPPSLMNLHRVLEPHRRFDVQVEILERYIKAKPEDFSGHIERASVYLRQGKTQDCVNDLYRAISLGGDEARRRIGADTRFALLMNSPDFRRAITPRAAPSPSTMPPSGFGTASPLGGAAPRSAP